MSERSFQALDSTLSLLHTIGQSGFDDHNGEANPWARATTLLVTTLKPHIKAYQLLESLPIKKDGERQTRFDQIDFMNTLAHIGYTAHSVDTTWGNINEKLLPCLFLGADRRLRVLVRNPEGKGVLYYDPHNHVFAPYSKSDTAGTCFVFKPYDALKNPLSSFMRNSTGYGWFRALVTRFAGSFLQIVLVGIVLNVIGLATPLYTMAIYDRVIALGASDMLPTLTLGVVLALGCEWLLRRVRSQGLSWIATRMDNLVGNQIFSQMINLPALLIERASVAAQIARMKTFESIRDFFSSAVFLSVLDIPFVVIAAAVIYMLAGPLVLIPVTGIALYAGLFWVMHKKIKMAIRLAAKASSARQQFAIDTFEKIAAVRGCGLAPMWLRTYRDLSGREMMAHFHLNFLGQFSETAAHVLTMIAAVATLGFGVDQVWQHNLTTGSLLATMMLVWRVLIPFYSLCTVLPRLEQLSQSIIQVNQLMEMSVENEEHQATASLTRLQGQLKFAHTSFRHSPETDIIVNNMVATLRAGDLTIVTGENGSGKTTLMKLIKGLYRPDSGALLIDGFDVRQLDPAELRRQIAYVPQQADIFEGSILDNVRLANPLASEDDIIQALTLADAYDTIRKMPNGLDTHLSRYGADSLGTQSLLAFKISLARAYLQPSPLLLIDELPNALLTGKAGRNLKDYLVRNKGKRSVVMVTYREDFMALADQIVTMRRGDMPVLSDSSAKTTETQLQVKPQEAA